MLPALPIPNPERDVFINQEHDEADNSIKIIIHLRSTYQSDQHEAFSSSRLEKLKEVVSREAALRRMEGPSRREVVGYEYESDHFGIKDIISPSGDGPMYGGEYDGFSPR